MISLGLDFGSTNTLVSVYNTEYDYPETITISTVSYKIPSFVAWSPQTNEYFYGQTAIGKIGNPKFKVIRAFKMMLQVQNPEILKERGFDEVNTPEKISELFIMDTLKNALGTIGEDKIDVLTVGIPEVWRIPGDGIHKNAHTLIREICERIHLAREIRIVTEPEAAAAYYAFNYAKKNHNSNFCGHILIVDYGGGTLDLTLSTVNPLEVQDAFGNRGRSIKYNMAIRTVKRTGDGTVTYDDAKEKSKSGYSVGIAGIAYMEAVVNAVLEENGISSRKVKEEESGKYSQLVLGLESELINRSLEVKGYFETMSFAKIMAKRTIADMKDDDFCDIIYRDNCYSVSYGTLAAVYNDTIAGKFAEEMNVILEYMKKENIRYMDGSSDTFQLALVGGFGNFCLVEKQLLSLLEIAAFSNGIVGMNNREKAIANGAALYANDVVGHQLSAPYSLGIRLQGMEGQEMTAYAFHHLDEMKAGKEFFVTVEGDKKPVALKNSTNFQNVFFSETDHSAGRKEKVGLRMKTENYNKLKELLAGSKVRNYNMSFSMDEEEHITVNIYGYDKLKKERTEKPVVQETLSELGELFITEKSPEGSRKRGKQ